MKAQTALAGLVSVAALLPEASAADVVVIRNPSVKEAAAEALAAPLIALNRRAAPEAPNGYVPTHVDCPSDRPVIREASTISNNETEWLYVRRNNTVSAMKDLLGRMNITGFDTNSYIDSAANNVSALPNIAIAGSGGGYRAMMNYAGAVAAFDNRTTNSTSAGQLGGLLQASTYLAGLSGGSWLVGSLFMNNFTTVESILSKDTSASNSGGTWQFEQTIFEGPAESGLSILNTAEYLHDLYDTVQDKKDAGYETSITDYWGRALSYQLINASMGGPAYTFSSIADSDQFRAGDTPMPILVTDGRARGELVIGGNATIYEFNPWELGTFDPTTFAFAPIRYLGSNFSDGVVVDGDMQCVRGFDNAGYVMGTSSSLFNQAFLQINGSTGLINEALTAILSQLGQDNDDIANYPNPFFGVNNATSRIANTDQLTLVDGGEDGQNIPLHPLIQPERHVDVIFAIDSSADTTADNGAANWPNGTSLVATYERTLLPISNGTSFPYVPDQQTFVNLGLNYRPTFFGCNSSNTTHMTPLIVYLPNAPYVYPSNVSTFDLQYNDTQRDYIIENGYDAVTQGNSTLDSEWPTCVGCAILSRSLERTNTEVPEVCNQCFQRYCWDGTVDSTVNTTYEPAFKLSKNEVLTFKSSGFKSVVPSLAFAISAVAAVMMVM
ncbi:lysophospholipase Plb2, partial [Aureobasidium melanogenum]